MIEIAIVDYGVGNLFSLAASLRHIGAECTVTGSVKEMEAADKVILPGVGAFGDAMAKLRASALADPVREMARAGKPLLGICLGMQLLFEKSYEYGEHEGLGLVPGTVENLRGDVPPDLKVPQIGWNALRFRKPEDPLVRDVGEGSCVYFVHSYYAKHCEESLVATAEYSVEVPAIVRAGNVWGTQFHPEKSGRVGLSILRAFCGEDVK